MVNDSLDISGFRLFFHFNCSAGTPVDAVPASSAGYTINVCLITALIYDFGQDSIMVAGIKHYAAIGAAIAYNG